jgi:hypothetical protein
VSDVRTDVKKLIYFLPHGVIWVMSSSEALRLLLVSEIVVSVALEKLTAIENVILILT